MIEFLNRPAPEPIAGARKVCLSRWVARIYRWNENLWPGADFGHADPVLVRMLASVGPELAETAIGIPVNYALRDPDLVRVHYTPDDGPVRPTYPEVYAGIVESCRADETGLLATLLISRYEAHADLALLERTNALGHAGLCLCWSPVVARTGRTPWGATVVDVERANAFAVGFTAHPHIAGCRVLRRLALDEELTEQDAIPPEPLVVPSTWRAGESGHTTPALVTSGAIATGKIAVNAVTQRLNTIGGGPTLTVLYQTIASIVVTTQGGTVHIDCGIFLEAFSGTSLGVDVLLTAQLRNTITGALGSQGKFEAPDDQTPPAGSSVPVFMHETPAAGTYTYVLEAKKNTTGYVCEAHDAYMLLKEFKR